jgi:hypothetical protein
MARKGRDIIVIGASAGGLDALDALIGGMTTELPAAIFVVQHLAPANRGEALLHRLGRHKAFRCKLASDGETFEETLWEALRMFEERKNLLNSMARKTSGRSAKGAYLERAKETGTHIVAHPRHAAVARRRLADSRPLRRGGAPSPPRLRRAPPTSRGRAGTVPGPYAR